LQSFEPRRFYGYQPSLHIIKDMVISIVLDEKYILCHRLVQRMANRKEYPLMLLNMDHILNMLPIRESTMMVSEEDIIRVCTQIK
jgi:hypothetical protein